MLLRCIAVIWMLYSLGVKADIYLENCDAPCAEVELKIKSIEGRLSDLEAASSLKGNVGWGAGNSELLFEHLYKDLSKIEISVRAKLEKFEDKISSAEVQSHHVSTLKEELNEIEDTLWNTYHWILAVVGLVTLLGAAFIWRENSSIKNRLELEEKNLEEKKKAIDRKIERSVKMLEDRASKELAIFQKKLILKEAILTNVVDSDEVYDAVRQLDLSPRIEYLALFRQLSEMELDDELQEAVQNAIGRIHELRRETQEE